MNQSNQYCSTPLAKNAGKTYYGLRMEDWAFERTLSLSQYNQCDGKYSFDSDIHFNAVLPVITKRDKETGRKIKCLRGVKNDHELKDTITAFLTNLLLLNPDKEYSEYQLLVVKLSRSFIGNGFEGMAGDVLSDLAKKLRTGELYPVNAKMRSSWVHPHIKVNRRGHAQQAIREANRKIIEDAELNDTALTQTQLAQLTGRHRHTVAKYVPKQSSSVDILVDMMQADTTLLIATSAQLKKYFTDKTGKPLQTTQITRAKNKLNATTNQHSAANAIYA
jgi:hypothetical protein